jgi:DNA-binding NarL/FixJ family response regulator
MMAVRRVFIVWSHSLFYGSVHLLLNHPDIEIIGASQESEAMWTEVQELRPDTIIIERRGEDDGGIPGVVASHIWSGPWGPSIIHAGLHDNTAQVYRREQHTLEQAEDLLRLILHE